jgi:hypothetical protein
LSIKSKVFAAAAAAALIGGVSAAGALSATTAKAATPSCGASCLDIFSKNFGTHHNPQFVLDDLKQSEKVGQAIILFRESNSDPAEDWTISDDGPASDFYAAGLVSPELALHYGCTPSGIVVNGAELPCETPGVDDYAFEAEYAPFGVDSGLCAGVASTAVSGEKVTLQPCGVSSKTVWIADTLDSCVTNPLYSDEIQLINGSDNNFSHPYVLQYPADGYPTDTPRPQLFVDTLTGFSQTGGGSGVCGGDAVTGPDNNQLWSAVEGVLP